MTMISSVNATNTDRDQPPTDYRRLVSVRPVRYITSRRPSPQLPAAVSRPRRPVQCAALFQLLQPICGTAACRPDQLSTGNLAPARLFTSSCRLPMMMLPKMMTLGHVRSVLDLQHQTQATCLHCIIIGCFTVAAAAVAAAASPSHGITV